MKKLLVLILCLVLSLSTISCKKDSAPAAGSTESESVVQEAIVTLNGITNTLDVNVANYTNTSTIMYHVMSKLISFDDNFNMQPAVVSEWAQTDAKTIELKINPDYVFHNGDPVTAEDVQYSILRLRDIPQTAGTVENVADVLVVDDQTLEIVTVEAKNNTLRTLAGSIVIVNKSLLESQGDDYWKNPVGSGPYKFESFIPGQEAVLTKWNDYPFTQARLEKLTFKNIEDPTSMYISLETGETDFINTIQYLDKDRAAENNAIKTMEISTVSTGFISLNATKAPFDNVLVRRALAHATDKESFALLTGDAKAIDSMIPSFVTGYISSEYTPAYDLEKAKDLLVEAGYEEGLSFTCSTYSADTSKIELLQADLKKIGVEMNIENLEFGVFLDKVLGADYDILFGSWGNTDGDVTSMLNCYSETSLAESNISFYTNPELEGYYTTAATTLDETEKMEALKMIQNIAAQDVPMIPTTSGISRYGMKKNLNGVKINPTGNVDFSEAYFD